MYLVFTFDTGSLIGTYWYQMLQRDFMLKVLDMFSPAVQDSTYLGVLCQCRLHCPSVAWREAWYMVLYVVQALEHW